MTGRYGNLFKNLLLFLANAFATKLISFVLVPLYTAFMSAGEYGITDMSVTVINLLVPLATLSISDSVIRYIVADGDNGSKYAGIGLFVTCASVFLVTCFAPLLDLGVFGGLGDYKGLFVLAYGANALMTLFTAIAQGRGKISLIPICAGLSSAITLVSAIVLIGIMRTGISGYFVSVSLGPVVSVIVFSTLGGLGGFAFRGIRGIFTEDEKLKTFGLYCRSLLKYSVPLTPNYVFWWLQTGISRFFIVGFLGISASGMFAAASKIPGLLNTAYSVFQQAWQLSVFRESKGNELESFYSTVFSVLFAAISTLCAFISFLAPEFASIMLQGETYAAWPLIPILLIANLVSVLNSFYGTVYTATMRTGYIMKTTVVGAVTCVVLTAILLPPFELYGACLASLAAQSVVLAFRILDSRRIVPFGVNWPIVAFTFALLTVQVLVVSIQVTQWRIASGACFVAITLVQVAHLTFRRAQSGISKEG